MALSEAEKEIVKQKVKNRRREMLGAGLDEPRSSNLNQTIQHDPKIVIESELELFFSNSTLTHLPLIFIKLNSGTIESVSIFFSSTLVA